MANITKSEIIFLGTAGDSQVYGKQIRASGGIIITVAGLQFHIDPGPGALVRAKQMDINLRENTAVLVSHNHILHSNDTNAVISAMTHSGLDKHGILIAEKTAIEGTFDQTPTIGKFFSACVERTIKVDADKRIGINEVEVKTTHTRHGSDGGVGFKFLTPKFSLSYVGDTAYFAELVDYHSNSDIIILNVVAPSGIKIKDQMNSDDAVKFFKKAKPKLGIITHFGLKMLSSDPLNEARYIQKEAGVQVIAAKDGMRINPASYSAMLKQRTLNLY